MQHDGRKGRGKGHIKQQRGMVLVLAVLLVSGLLLIAGTSSLNSTGQTKITSVELDNTRTFYAAEAGVEWGASELRTLLLSNLDPTQEQLNQLPSPSIQGFTFNRYQIAKTGALTQETISSGDYTGLYGYVQRYVVQARASSNRRSAEIQREIQHQYIPLFQFGVFYDKDLEIIPGPTMTFAGRVHTNANLYMAAETGISCNSYVTAVGAYRHYRKDNNAIDPPGYVRVKDQAGVYQDVWRGSYWLDSRRATWAPDALALWGGMFRDQSHGLAVLKLPLPPASDQHVIVERGVVGDDATTREAKYWYKAAIRYVDGVLTDSLGNPLNHPGVYTYTANKFWDARQSRWMDVVDINISAMVAGGYSPSNGILYVTNNSGDAPAIRLINAQTLPSIGLTIATDLPLYVKGHYNTTPKRGSALLCDAITLLSPNWLDSKSNQALNNRVATAMSINACIMTGHVSSVENSSYSGGLENLFRFLEKWTGVSMTFRGSIIDLWFSQRATAPWSYGVFYTAPNRNWGFDTDLLSPSNWPPGTPRVHTIQRAAWRQIS
jgi:hypothetical protein